MRKLLTLGVAAVTAVAALAAQSAREVRVETPFDLKAGESVRVAGEKLAVRLEGVTADSRCPEDVECVWAGDATALVRLEKPPEKAETFALHTMPRFGSDAKYHGLVVRLEAVNPRPRTDRTIAPGDYRVTLVVRRPKAY
jgi:hypothetical protein